MRFVKSFCGTCFKVRTSSPLEGGAFMRGKL